MDEASKVRQGVGDEETQRRPVSFFSIQLVSIPQTHQVDSLSLREKFNRCERMESGDRLSMR